MIMKEAEKIVKFKDLAIAIQRMWYVRTKSDSSRNMSILEHLKIIQKISEIHTGKHDIQEVKKQPYWVVCTYYVFREVLMQKYKPVIMGR